MATTSMLTERLSRILGPARVSVEDADRFVYGRDCWPKTILYNRRGEQPWLPHCVVFPDTADEVAAVVALCSELRTPVIAYGGGSGVCGGVVPVQGGVTIDMKKLKKAGEIDPLSLTVEAEAGILGSHLEEHLNIRGYTLGHFPSSIMCSTLGGWLAGRSAGQCSSRYGKIEDMVTGLELVLADGSQVRISPPLPHLGGIDWNAIFVGSEGVLGVITKAWLKVHPLPAYREFASYAFPSLQAGLEGMRQVMQAGLRPAVLRIYDPLDTFINRFHSSGDKEELWELAAAEKDFARLLMKEGKVGMKQTLMFNLLRRPAMANRLVRQLPTTSLLVTIFEGDKDIARRAAQAADALFTAAQGVPQGEGPARHWLENRYAISFKQMNVFRSGAFVDTMEVSAPWEQVPGIYYGVRHAVGKLAFVMAHCSHAYEEGCAVYFTFSSAVKPGADLMARYDEVWSTALRTVLEQGGTLSHHHGVGLNKAGFMVTEHGGLMGTLRALKRNIDPAGVLNPGKLGL